MYSSLEEASFRVPEWSILGPLLFDIFTCDLFWIISKTDFSNYGDNVIKSL